MNDAAENDLLTTTSDNHERSEIIRADETEASSGNSSAQGTRRSITTSDENLRLNLSTSETPHPEESSQQPRCTYSHNCTLSSPLRKVVSHFFGRNKKCTRCIPAWVWIHLCRQHYQRMRYRSNKDFSAIQMDFIIDTLHNLARWDGVLDVEITLRKRAGIQYGAKRQRYRESCQRARMDGRPVPEMGDEFWMDKRLGKGKTLEEARAFVDGIRQRLNAATDFSSEGYQVPEFEILPTVREEPRQRVGKQSLARSNSGRVVKSRSK